MARKSGSSIGVLIAGALAGVVGALLLAPKAGKDTRDLVRRKATNTLASCGRSCSGAKATLTIQTPADRLISLARLNNTASRRAPQADAPGLPLQITTP
jgi:hypothetical protein